MTNEEMFGRQPTIVMITIEAGHDEDVYKARLLIENALRNHYADVQGRLMENGYAINCYPFAVND